MVKIIKEGTKEIVKCEKCGCTFSYEKEDVRVSFLGNEHRKEYVFCPNCGSEFTIITGEIKYYD